MSKHEFGWFFGVFFNHKLEWESAYNLPYDND